MRYSRTDLLQLKGGHLSLDEDLTFADDISSQFPRIRRISDVSVKADGDYRSEEQRLYVNFRISGTVIVGCDVTGEDVEVPIDTEEDAVFSFNKNEDDITIIPANGQYIELLPEIFRAILLDIPTKVVKPGKIDYPKGDGWEVVSEEVYEQQKKNEADPRLAKLLEYIPQDEQEV